MDQILTGDCLRHLTELPESCVDLAFADPPFNIGYDYDVYHDRQSRADYLAWTERWLGAVRRVLKPTGSFYIAIGDEYAAELKLLFQKELGLTCRSWVVWYYTFGVHCTRKFSRSHAHLFYFVKDPKHFTFNADAVKVPSARQLVYAAARAAPAGCPTTPGSCARKTCRTASRRTKTPGTSPASPAPSRSERDSTVARCPSNFWVG
jgi:site-specific DNA-methyltransferase (adenine-specific)